MKKTFGYLRYDTYEELSIMNDLYCNELRLYKSLFLNPAELKRNIDAKPSKLHQIYEDKEKSPTRRSLQEASTSYG